MLLISSVASIFIADILTFYNPTFGQLGFIAWIVSYGFIVCFAIKSLLYVLKYIYHHQTYFSFVLLMILVLVVVVHAFNINNGSLESTQQIGCTINQLLYKTDMGFRDYCFIGYPTRQYYIPSLLTMLLGPSYGTLNMSYSIYILAGLTIFTAGLLQFFKKYYGTERADIATALGLASLLHLFFFSHILLMYEQSIFPLSIGLSGAGLMLGYFSKRKFEYLAGASIILFHLIYAYTPALALYAFGIALFVYLAARSSIHKNHRFFMFLTIAGSAVCMFLSLKMRTDIQLIGGEHGSTIAIKDLMEFGKNFVIRHDVIFSTWAFHVIFLLAIVASLISLKDMRMDWKKGWRICATMMWAIAAICFGTFSKGYATPPPAFGIHRGLVVMPVLIPLILYIFVPIIKRIPLKFLYAILVLFFANGLLYHAQYVKDKDKFANRFVNFREFARYSRYMKFLSYTIKKNDQVFTVYFDTQTSQNFQAIDTARKYYYPQSEFNLLNEDCDVKDTKNTTIYVAYNEPVCKNMKFRYLGTFIFHDEKPMRIYQVAQL
jgi:hypothetical protein